MLKICLTVFLILSSKGISGPLSAHIDAIKNIANPVTSSLESIAVEIEKLLSSEQDPLSDKSKQAAKISFYRVLDLMIKDLPNDVQETIIQMVVNRKYVDIEYGTVFKLNSGFKNSSIEISLPEKYRGSFIEYDSLTHEVMHAIQVHSISGLPYTDGDLPPLGTIKFRAYLERGAMSWEWAYLKIIPDHIANEFKLKLQDDPSWFVQGTIRALQNKNLDRRNYLRAEYNSDRYSLQAIGNHFFYDQDVARFNKYKRIFVNTVKYGAAGSCGYLATKYATAQIFGF